MITRISVISDRPDYSNIYVSDGIEIIEKAGGPPWRTLFQAVFELKIRQLKRKIHGKAAEGNAVKVDSISTGVSVPRFALSPSGNVLHLPSKDRQFPGHRSILEVRGKSIDRLSKVRPLRDIPTREAK